MKKHMTYLRFVMYSYVQEQLCDRGSGGWVGVCIGLQFDGVVIRFTYRKNVNVWIATAVYHSLHCTQCRTNKEDYGT